MNLPCGLTILLTFCCMYGVHVYSKYTCVSTNGELRVLPQASVSVIDGHVKENILLSIPQRTNDTIAESEYLVHSCGEEINITVADCEACAKESCDKSSADEIVEKKKLKLHKVLLPLLYNPLKQTVFTVKIIEKSLGKLLKVIGLKGTEKFLNKFGDVVEGLGKDLLKNAKDVVKDAGKLLEKFGKGLADLAKDIGKGLKDSVKKIGKEAGRLGKKIGKALEKIGKGVEKAAKRVIKDLPKALKKLGSKVKDIAKKAGKGIAKTVKKITKPIGKAVKRIGNGIGRAVRKIFGGWGKRSTRYRRLAECASICPSCQQVDSEDPDVLISNVCGADHLVQRKRLLETVEKIQLAYNASIDETTNIISKIEYESDSMVGFSEYNDVYVTIKSRSGSRRYKSPIPLDALRLSDFAAGVAVKVFEYI